MNSVPSIYNLLKSIFKLSNIKINFEYYYLNFLLELITNSNRNLNLFFPFEIFDFSINKYCFKTVFKLLILKSCLENNYCSNKWTKNSTFLIQAFNLRKKQHKIFAQKHNLS